MTDVLNREQAAVVINWISNDMQANGEYISLYNIPSMHSGTLIGIIKEVLSNKNLKVTKLQGQCYADAGAMKGIKLFILIAMVILSILQ